MSITVSIVIHEDFQHIRHTLNSLRQNTTYPLNVIITINAGTPEAVKALQRDYPDLEYRINEYPLGFAANHNRILQEAVTSYVFVLNDDVELHPGALDKLVGCLEHLPDTGLVGGRIVNPDGSPQISVFSDPSLIRMLYRISGLAHWSRTGSRLRAWIQRSGLAGLIGTSSLIESDTIRDVAVIVGVAMLVRRSACLQAGYMDESTRFYGEEMGWHLRLRQAGWRVVQIPDAVITHFNTAQVLDGWKLAEHRRSILSYYTRYRPCWQAQVIRMAILGFHGLYTLLWLPFNRKQAHDQWQAARTALQPAKTQT